MNGSQLPSQYQQFIHLSRYSRFIDSLNRRETWEETVDRLVSFYKEHLKESVGFKDEALIESLRSSILSLEVLPSMRALMASGPAGSRDNVALYNCSYIAVDSPRSFDEALYVLMCGTGVGFSVERQYVNKLPVIPDELHPTKTVIVVEDSKIGWAKALKQLIAMLYAGEIPGYDTSRLRDSGARLKTMGGRSSGPQPLIDLFEFTIKTFENAKGRRLESIECHDLMCKIGEIVVVGGVRRSALISLSNLSDLRMREAKSGQWWNQYNHRSLANNSVAYTEKPDIGTFMEEWTSLYKSKSGERGIFNRAGAKKKMDEAGREFDETIGTNPCGEILLRSLQFCNLTEVVARPTDTADDLKKKIVVATILGTIQSTFTDFRYIRKRWKDNCDEERLLGVSITGIMDNPLLNKVTPESKEIFAELRALAHETNEKYAEAFGIPKSAAVTCVKPSGTASKLAGTSSGIHPRYAKNFINRVTQDKKDPLTQFMISVGFPHEEDKRNPSAVKFLFPQTAPDTVIVDSDVNALERLEHWMMVKTHFCDHNPSTTINVAEGDWMKVGAWVYENFDAITGLSFLPEDLGSYIQAPLTRCTLEEAKELEARIPKVDWSRLAEFEKGDTTTGTQELACVAGGCEI